jgi:hypothetical protein
MLRSPTTTSLTSGMSDISRAGARSLKADPCLCHAKATRRAWAARQLDQDLADSPAQPHTHAFYCLMGTIYPIHDNEHLRAERDHVFSAMLERWPNQDRAPGHHR